MARKNYNIKGARNQDLIAARQELKEFRHDIAILKRKGLLSKSYDARSVTPSKYLKSQIKLFSDVLNGNSASVKVSKSVKNIYKDNGYRTKNNRVVVSVNPGEKAYSSHGNVKFKVVGSGGSITRAPLALKTNDILKWGEILNSKIKLKKGERIGFQFFGNNSHAIYENLNSKTAVQQMSEDISRYPVFSNINHLDPNKEQEIIENISIYIIKPDKNGKYIRPAQSASAREISQEQKRINSIRNKSRYENRLNRMTHRQEERFLEEKRAREKERRESIKQNPEKLIAYREAAKQRAVKARNAKKKNSSL